MGKLFEGLLNENGIRRKACLTLFARKFTLIISTDLLVQLSLVE